MQTGEIVFYQTKDGESSIEVKLQGETLWLTQEQMAHLFQKERSVITKHINNIFKEGELDQKSNVQILHIAQSGKPVKHFPLDVVISVGYRVKSQCGTQFRIWAKKVFREYLTKGYALDQRKLRERTASSKT